MVKTVLAQLDKKLNKSFYFIFFSFFTINLNFQPSTVFHSLAPYYSIILFITIQVGKGTKNKALKYHSAKCGCLSVCLAFATG